MKTCVIRQPAGLGDILFALKIAYKLKEKGYNIVWPVINEFAWINEYIEGINFCSLDSDFICKDKFSMTESIINNDELFVPLQDADRYFPNESVMIAKYLFVGLDYNNWQDYIKVKRNADKEQKLRDHIGMQDNIEYTLINNTFGSPPDSVECIHMRNINASGPIIRMHNIPGFSVFDWMGVMERCNIIHTTDTCTIYLIETLKRKQELYMYSRFNPSNFFHVHKFLKKQWNFMQ